MLEDLKDKIAEEEDQWKNQKFNFSCEKDKKKPKKIEKIIFFNNNKKYQNLIKF